LKVEIYSDIVCPWCYIGERRLERALADFPGRDEIEVVYRPFQLDPAAPEHPVPMADHLRAKFGHRVEEIQAHVTGAAAGEGIRMRFDDAVVVNTLSAHRVLRLAELEHGAPTQRAVAEKLFEAYFERAANISDPEVLASLAGAAGMDPVRVREYLSSLKGVEETLADLRAAVDLGVRAVPTFVFDGRFAVEGAQPASTLLAVLERLSTRAEAEVPAGSDAGACADGSCDP